MIPEDKSNQAPYVEPLPVVTPPAPAPESNKCDFDADPEGCNCCCCTGECWREGSYYEEA